MFKQFLNKIRTMDKQELTAFGTCGLFLLLGLIQLLILAASPFGRTWDHILLLLVDIAIAAFACYMGFRWKKTQGRSAAVPPSSIPRPSQQPPRNARPSQQPPQNARPSQQLPQNVRPSQQPPQNARPSQQPPQNARPSQQTPQNARPSQQSFSMEDVPNTLGSQSLPTPSIQSLPQNDLFDDTDWDDEF